MGAIRGLLLDESLLLAGDDEGNSRLLPAASVLLRRLRHSKLRVGICYQEGVPSHKVALLANAAAQYSLDCIEWNTSCADDTFNRLLLSWSAPKGTCVYATSRRVRDLLLQLSSHGWKVILKSSEVVSSEIKEALYISQLEELFFTLYCHNKMAVDQEPCNASIVSVGYVMKPSREEDFAKRGAFPIYPTQNGLMFVPITFELSLSLQMQQVDVVLHKATDEIISIDPCTDSPRGITFSTGMQQLERYIQEHADCCIIDPLNNISPLVDRLKIQELLVGLESLSKKNKHRVRAPHFLKVDNYHELNLEDRLTEAKLSFPNIVKPQVACGVADAHSMALVFEIGHYKDLLVPLPAVIQEYVDHGSVLYKFYALGEKVFYATKKSMPNADVLCLSSSKNGSKPILFDSLKSLPTADVDLEAKRQSLDVGLVTEAANWLRKQLDLTIFGFDVVIHEGSGDHVIVDVNYLPSFKEIPDSDGIPAFWDAIRSSYEAKKAKEQN